ncbi:LOW QUALITY PROTEIN: SS18-like protein 2 [Urocitellus parryii]
MSVAFVPDWMRGKAEANQETIQNQRKLLENDQLIRIVKYQNKGVNKCVQNQIVLHRNLIYLATIADANSSSTSKAMK